MEVKTTLEEQHVLCGAVYAEDYEDQHSHLAKHTF